MTWISVKDELPEDDANVLGYSEGYAFSVAYHTKKGWFYHPEIDHESGDNSLIDVTHWMPLPEVSGD